jgi:hypothetical protein
MAAGHFVRRQYGAITEAVTAKVIPQHPFCHLKHPFEPHEDGYLNVNLSSEAQLVVSLQHINIGEL